MRRTPTERPRALRPALIAALLTVLLAGLLTGCTGAERGAGGASGLPAPLPELELGGFDGGETAQLADLRGPMVINLWASWCNPCVEEMPILQDYHRKHGERVQVVGIDYTDPQVDEAMDLVKQTGVTYPLYTDLGGDLNGLGPFPRMRGLPFLAFVDEEGRVVAHQFVIIDDVEELEALVEEHLGVVA